MRTFLSFDIVHTDEIFILLVSFKLAYRTHILSGYGYECTELTEVPGAGINVLQNLQKFMVGQYPG